MLIKNPWGGGNKEARAGETFCSCCGSAFRTGNRIAYSWGINLWEKMVGRERDDDEKHVKHLKTRNGTITISIKKKF